jgi:biotin carboxyl carrier protein
LPQIKIGGELIEPAAASLLEVSPGIFSVLFNGQSFEVRVLQNEAIIQGHRFPFEIHDPRRWNRSAAGLSASGPASVVSSMPGKVVRFLVAAGDEVRAGQGIVVVEAMKMQNELKSPRDGRVTALKASPGDSVNAGAVLALVE